jgi:tripartite-type tricarboxylate transporter receptor subunit TctC
MAFIHRRSVIAGALGFLACAPFGATAQTFPRSPVKLVVPFPPGGPTDTVARMISMRLQEGWGQPVVLDYKPGAGTVIGVDAVAKSAGDGYTLGMVNSAFAVNPSLRKTMPYDTLRDLAGVTQLANLELAIVARPDAPFSNLSELIAYARKNPGKLNYGTPGAGGTGHLGAELLKKEAGFEMLHIAMKVSAPAHTELMGGRLDLIVDPLLSVLPFVQAGRMKIIATMGAKRAADAGNFATVSEVIPGFNVGALLGIVVPSSTPAAVRKKIQTDIAKLLGEPEVRSRMTEMGMEVVASTPEQFDGFIAAEMKRWAPVIRDAKIQPE